MRRVFVVAITVAVVGVTLATLFLVPAIPKLQAFDLSRTLPTGTTYFNGQEGCGTNVTISDPFPANGIVTYSVVQLQPRADVNIWFFGPGSYSFVSTGMGSGHGQFSTGSGEFTVVLKACGPGPTVSLGFWGNTTYLAPVL
jgi:hypothetical protein